jgi:hypothetical protein
VALVDARSAPFMYTGNYNSVSAAPVGGLQASYSGLYVCRSSASSNSVCGIKVTAVNLGVKVNQGPGLPLKPLGPLVQGDQIWHASAAGHGDSGGAIYTNRSGGGVNAVGIHSSGYSAGEYYAPCTGIPESDIRKCGWRILWVDLEQTFAYYGGNMTLLTELGA